jgi:hypothetical protein
MWHLLFWQDFRAPVLVLGEDKFGSLRYSKTKDQMMAEATRWTSEPRRTFLKMVFFDFTLNLIFQIIARKFWK